MHVEEKLTGRNNDIVFFIDKIYTDSMTRDILQHLSNGTDLSKLNISVQVPMALLLILMAFQKLI